jgi:uncharacterized protein
MFKINLSSFEGRKELRFTLKKEEISFEDEIQLEDGMKIRLTITKDTGNSVIVEGAIEGKVRLNCGRCLEDYSQTVNSVFAAVFKEKSVYTDDDKESDVYVYSNNTLDLYDYLRDTLILELPVKPLCKEGCLGICPKCGRNRNKEECACKP